MPINLPEWLIWLVIVGLVISALGHVAGMLAILSNVKKRQEQENDDETAAEG